MSGISQDHVSACKALDQTQSAAAYVNLSHVKEGLEFLQAFLDMADRNCENLESWCLPGMSKLIQFHLDYLYRTILILCPEIDALEAQEIQKEIKLQNIRYGAAD